MEPSEFQGTIGRYHFESQPWWPRPAAPPEGAPNVLVVLLDDVGFAQLGCFGSDIDTPTFDRLAAGGLRYRNFHTTALCSPTRACVLTGRNHHSVGMGRITDLATGFPGYDARIPRSCGFLPRILTDVGYAAYAVGKWHLTPEEECHLGARRDRWPLGRGFERWYGFFGGETHQFAPPLVHDSHFVEPPASYEDGYHLTEDLADRAIEFVTDLRHVDPAKPWFCYFATGACHSPHQAPTDWIARYRARFDDGWDSARQRILERQKSLGIVRPHTELSPRPEWVPAWDSLSTHERRVHARYMEAFAGFLSHADAQVGRVLDWLERLGELDNTLVMVMSDNGASSEGGPVGSLNDVRLWNGLPRTVEEAVERIDEIGGPRIHNNYPWGWTVAGNTPFRRWKRETHEGGVADPLIVHWPAGIDGRGEIRDQYVHAIDVLPTVLDVLGIKAPAVLDGVEQRPIEGVSFAYTFAEAGRDAPERHTTQYYEMFGCRALYQDGWKAVVYHDIQSDEPGLDQVRWELYDLRADPSECHDLAAAEPERLAAMVERWWVEAERCQVLPLDNRPFSDLVFARPSFLPDRHRYVFYPGFAMVPEAQGPHLTNRPHAITAYVRVPPSSPGEVGVSGSVAGEVEGVLVSQGSVLGGWSLHVAGGRLSYVHNLSGWREDRVDAELGGLEPGDHTLGFRFTPATAAASAGGAGGGSGRAGARAELLVDDVVVGEGVIERFTWSRFSLTGHGITVGRTFGTPPADDYASPFPVSGATLDRVEIVVDGDPHIDGEARARDAVAMQ
jgi:arylsulfatase A-like enzyme